MNEKPHLPPMLDRFDFHRQHPDVSVQEYVVQQETEIAFHAYRKCRIYLDQNYWCYCRDADRGQPQRGEHARVYSLLTQGVERGILTCPANYEVVHETCKQGDLDLRLATARVVDRLSGGVAVKNLLDLVQCELLDYWDDQHGNENAVRRSDLCFTKIGCFLGTPISPDHMFLSDADNLILKKVFLDYMLNVPLVTLLQHSRLSPSKPTIADEVNRGCASEPCRTFGHLFRVEVLGAAFTAAEILLEQADINLLERDFIECLVRTITPEYVGPYLRCIRIQAGLKAEVRFQKQRSQQHQTRMFTANDLDDHNHATVALPHSDFFFTERVLTHYIRSPRLRYDKLFGCTVLYRPADIVNALTALLANPQ